MKIFHNMLIALLCAVSFTTHIDSHQALKTQPIFINKLKKAWQNNWVKAGTVTAACALLYTLGTKLNSIALTPVCTGTTQCSMCHPKLINNNLFWKSVGIISGLATLAYGYAYFNAQNNDADYQELADAEENNAADEIELNDAFFEFTDEQTESTTNDQGYENQTEIQNLINVENNITFEDIINEEETDTPSDIIAFENFQDSEMILPSAESTRNFLTNNSLVQ